MASRILNPNHFSVSYGCIPMTPMRLTDILLCSSGSRKTRGTFNHFPSRVLLPVNPLLPRSVWPVIGVISIAMGWCGFMSTRHLLTSPDVSINPSRRAQILKGTCWKPCQHCPFR